MKAMKFILLLAFGLLSGSIYSQQNQDIMTNQEIVVKFFSRVQRPSTNSGIFGFIGCRLQIQESNG